MRITVELSLYPLSENFVEPVKKLIERLKAYKDIEMVVTATSTQIVGEHGHVFDILSKETATTFSSGKSLFVIKIIGFERDIKRYVK